MTNTAIIALLQEARVKINGYSTSEGLRLIEEAIGGLRSLPNLENAAFEPAELAHSEEWRHKAWDDLECIGVIVQADGHMDDSNDVPADCNVELYGPVVEVMRGDRIVVLRNGKPILPSNRRGDL